MLKHTFIPILFIHKNSFEILVGYTQSQTISISIFIFFPSGRLPWKQKISPIGRKKIIINKKILGEMKKDVDFGMLFLQYCHVFFLITYPPPAPALYKAGIRQIDTVGQAAKHCEPLTGKLTYLPLLPAV
jgi:hypothetical protein